MERITQKIAFRLFVLIASIQTVILLGLTYAVVRVQQSTTMAQITLSATRLSDLVGRSTRYSMLLNRKDDVQNIVVSCGQEPGIEEINIYNKQGELVFGSDSTDLHLKVDVDAEACNRCHGAKGLQPPEEVSMDRHRIYTDAAGTRVLGLITPIRNEHECSDAACHAHPASKTILGVLDLKMSLREVDARLADQRNQLLALSALAVILIGVVAGGFLWLFVSRPVRRLITGMEMVAAGRLDRSLDARSSDELGRLARAFNDMTRDLAWARKENRAWSQTLEKRVSEKTADLEEAHRQMLRVEKMASLGNLASSVAHELNNPLEGILTFAKLLMKKIAKSGLPAEEVDSYHEDLQLIADEALRSGTIVRNLLVFARQKGTAFQVARFREILNRSSLLVHHHAEMNDVQMITTCTADDTLECDPGQVQQILVALMMNAIEAMPPLHERVDKGAIAIDVTCDPKKSALVVQVKDNGMGMSEGTKAHMFEPFFTTKSEGKGVGLGLAITYGIVERHHGTIDVESAVGKGTTFTITFPMRQPQSKESQPAPTPVEGANA